MIENYQEIIDKMSKEEAMKIVSKMGMNMTDHPYLSEARRQELKDKEQKEIEEYENKRKESTSGNWMNLYTPCKCSIGNSTCKYLREWRRGPESNRRIEDLQSPALPLGYRAVLQNLC